MSGVEGSGALSLTEGALPTVASSEATSSQRHDFGHKPLSEAPVAAGTLKLTPQFLLYLNADTHNSMLSSLSAQDRARLALVDRTHFRAFQPHVPPLTDLQDRQAWNFGTDLQRDPKPLWNSLTSSNAGVREAALLAIGEWAKQQPSALDALWGAAAQIATLDAYKTTFSGPVGHRIAHYPPALNEARLSEFPAVRHIASEVARLSLVQLNPRLTREELRRALANEAPMATMEHLPNQAPHQRINPPPRWLETPDAEHRRQNIQQVVKNAFFVERDPGTAFRGLAAMLLRHTLRAQPQQYAQALADVMTTYPATYRLPRWETLIQALTNPQDGSPGVAPEVIVEARRLARSQEMA